MKLIPASSALWMILIASSWSGLPKAPNIMAPRHIWLTETPVRPRGRYSMESSLVAASERGGRVESVGERIACPLTVPDNLSS